MGNKLLNEIEVFRMFLHSVERYPMDRIDGPGAQAGSYEKYLPYAVALEVEQQWADKHIALSSSSHHQEDVITAHSFYLGMWNGKPVEILLTQCMFQSVFNFSVSRRNRNLPFTLSVPLTNVQFDGEKNL
jgi:hypothetical protein